MELGPPDMGAVWLHSQPDKMANEPVIHGVMAFEVDDYKLEPMT